MPAHAFGSHQTNTKSAAAPARRKSTMEQTQHASAPALNAAWAQVAVGIQRKVTVTPPDDPFEHEADAVADHVMRMVDPQHVADAPPPIQRKCACGETGGSCGCDKHDPDEQRLQTKRSRAFAAPIAARTLAAARTAQRPGAPLSPAARAYFEPRFGRDFGDVRVHTDAGAATAAQGIQARAYTLGRSVVFGAGEFAPDTDRGRRLLAHELTHVVQQNGGGRSRGIARTAGISSGSATIQREVASVAQLDSPAANLVTAAQDPKRDPGVRGTALVWGILQKYFPAESTGLWVNVVSFEAATAGLATSQVGTGSTSQGKIVVGNDFRDSTSTGTFEARVADVGHAIEKIELWRRGKAVPDACDPARALTWADFTGAVGSYTAYTGFDHTLATVQGEQIVRATFAPSRSYVIPAAKDPTNRATSGCGAAITQCKTRLKGKKDVTLPLAGSGGCAASVQPNASVVATSSSDCEPTLGPECDRIRQLDSERLLRHEQLHFDIACALARKGTRALSLKPADSVRILQAVKDKAHLLGADGGAYDTETNHSCNAGAQAAWESSVGMGMPMVVIT